MLRNLRTDIMPGVLLHLAAGSALFIIGRYYFRNYFIEDYKKKERILLAAVCLSFSILPDFFLVIYYTTHILPFNVLAQYHFFTHLIFTPIAITILLIFVNTFNFQSLKKNMNKRSYMK